MNAKRISKFSKDIGELADKLTEADQKVTDATNERDGIADRLSNATAALNAEIGGNSSTGKTEPKADLPAGIVGKMPVIEDDISREGQDGEDDPQHKDAAGNDIETVKLV